MGWLIRWVIGLLCHSDFETPFCDSKGCSVTCWCHSVRVGALGCVFWCAWVRFSALMCVSVRVGALWCDLVRFSALRRAFLCFGAFRCASVRVVVIRCVSVRFVFVVGSSSTLHSDDRSSACWIAGSLGSLIRW